MNDVRLSDVWPTQLAELMTMLDAMGRSEIGEQLSRVTMPAQDVNGSPKAFSFMAYPLPRLTYEERSAMELRPCESILLRSSEGKVTIDLDDFGQVNWFWLSDLPAMYESLTTPYEQARS